MEIKLRNGVKTKTIDIDKAIVSIQYEDQTIIDNLISDYNAVVIDNTKLYAVSNTVLDEIMIFNKYPELDFLGDIIKFFGEENSFFAREIKTLTNTEKIYLNILRNLSVIDKVIIFKDLFLGLDLNNQRSLFKIITYLRELGYIVFICSNDVDILYRYSDYSILSSKSIIKYDKTDDIYSDVTYLLKHEFEVPTLAYITYRAKKDKNVRLFYRRDVRDIIKDIYKHV